MTRRRVITPLVLVATLGLPACWGPVTGGEPVTQVRDAADVRSVVLETSGDLVVAVGATPRLEVTAGADVLDDLTSRVEGGTLLLGASAGSVVRGAIRYRLTTPSLTSVTVRGSGSARADFTGASHPAVAVEGSGTVHAGHVDAASVTTEVTGSGRVTVSGRAGTQTVSVERAGAYAAYGLECADAAVRVDGSGSAQVRVTGSLSATVVGSGSVTYRGDPRVERDVHGSGEVTAG